MAKKMTNKTSYGYSKIRWKESDYKRLRNAVNSFNREVKKHIGEIPDKALPKLKEYKDVKSNIYSRKDLELAISTMKNIKNKSAFKLVSSESNPNVKFTKWELQTAKRYAYRDEIKTQIEYNKYTSGVKKATKLVTDVYGNPLLDEQGRPMTKATFDTAYMSKLETYIEKPNYDMLLEARDYARKEELLERIYRRGTDDFEYQKAKIYKENYLKMLEGYENLDNYEEVKEKLESISEKEFYNFIKEHDTNSDNFQEHYDNRMIQIEFNNFARDLGVEIDDTIEPVAENIF